MRNLTILRKNSIPGSKKNLEVYIEDRENPTLTIEETPCRKLGHLQCGEQKTFYVGEEKAVVYVLDPGVEYALIGDKTTIPAGQKDLYLVGKVHYGKDAPFRFSGPATGTAPSYHPFSAQKGLIVIIALSATLLAPLLLDMMPKPGHENDGTLEAPLATYSEAGVTMELPNNFQVAEAKDYTLTYTTNDVAVFMLQEPFQGAELEGFADWTVREYAEYVAEQNRIDPQEVQMHGSIPYYTYTSRVSDGSEFFYHVFTFKTEDAFWLVNFAVEEGDKETYETAIFQWADTIVFE